MRFSMFVLVLGLVALAGCGSSDTRPKAVPAKGSVFYKNSPAGGVLVVFHPLDKGRENAEKPVATTKEDGTFVLTTYNENDGAPEGEYGITLVWNQKAKDQKFSLNSEGGGGGVDKFGGRYGDPGKPKIKKTVKKGDPNEFKLEVE